MSCDCVRPGLVGDLGTAFITAQQQTGVAATAKHFPGLGAAARWQNTDARTVVLDIPLSEIRAVDETPFESAIAAGVRLVTVSWAQYPALDPGVPAGLSSAVVQNALRARLGFRGVTVTDSLKAKSLAAFGGFGDRAELAAAAGMDLILCAKGSVSEGIAAMDGLQRGYLNGKLDRSAFEASLQRVVSLRFSLGVSP